MTSEELENRLIDLVEALPKNQAAKHLGGQLLRSGTSPALNYGEARAAESTADFVHKKKVCLKELRKTYICIRIIAKRNWFAPEKLTPIITENNELISIFVAGIKTSEEKKGNKLGGKK